MRVQEEIGARPELARTHVAYARILDSRGEGAKAKTHAAEACRMFEGMRMTWDIGEAEHLLRRN